jgi:hypothetical protein
MENDLIPPTSKRLRDGYFGVFQGKEFEFSLTVDGKVLLLSSHENDSDNGFVKTVSRGEIVGAYSVAPMAKYRGLNFTVLGQDIGAGKISITTDDQATAERLEFSRADKFYWEKWVPITELEKIWEERTSLDL